MLTKQALQELRNSGYRYLIFGDTIPDETLELWWEEGNMLGEICKIIKPTTQEPADLRLGHDYIPISISPFEHLFYSEFIVWFVDPKYFA